MYIVQRLYILQRRRPLSFCKNSLDWIDCGVEQNRRHVDVGCVENTFEIQNAHKLEFSSLQFRICIRRGNCLKIHLACVMVSL
jgi:hypothetical protein